MNIDDSQRHDFLHIKSGKIISPDGVYIFVIRSESPGKIIAMKQQSGTVGHTSLTRRNDIALPVRFAGTLHYRKGLLIQWTNNSGHYQPNKRLAHFNLIPWVRRLLPANKFCSIT